MNACGQLSVCLPVLFSCSSPISGYTALGTYLATEISSVLSFQLHCYFLAFRLQVNLVFECGDSFLLSVGHESKDADMRYVNSRVQGAFLDM